MLNVSGLGGWTELGAETGGGADGKYKSCPYGDGPPGGIGRAIFHNLVNVNRNTNIK